MKYLLYLSILALLIWCSKSAAADRPNIVLIYADDLGYGDVGCYGATEVKTPNIDRLAKEGVRFTDGHSASAVCTPSRYAMLTGEYAWRQKGTGILPGDAPLIIEPGRVTLASMLHDAGYSTGVVGKWHLGLGRGRPDWNGEITPGPLEIGFDYCYIIPATGDRVPCVYVENRHVVGLDPKDPIQVNYREKIGDEPTGALRPDLLKLKTTPGLGHDNTIVSGISRIGYMTGGKAARWKDEDMADVLTRQAIGFIHSHRDKPFFLYLATHDTHVPRVPHPRFRGATKMGARGDVIVELDWTVGQIMTTLDELKLAENTLVLFSSDNGPVVRDGYVDQAVELLGNHNPAGPLRGHKSTAYEGGTRVPFILRWPGRVTGGSKSDALVCQIDLLASLAALTGQKLPKDAGPDSVNVMSALLGRSRTGRDTLVEHARSIGLRQGNWKLIEPAIGEAKSANAQGKGPPQPQLYNLSDDLGENANLAKKRPDKVKEMRRLLDEIRKSGRMP